MYYTARWKVPPIGSSEGRFLDLIAESPEDFYEFVHKTFAVGKHYTVRRRTVNGTPWFLCNDPCLDGGNVLGLKLDSEEAERAIKKMVEEGRIKILDG